MRNVQDWNKYVDMLGKAVAKKAPPAPRNGLEAARVLPPDLLNGAGPAAPSASPPPRKGRGPRKEETREELLRRLVDPTLTLEETACILEVCPTTVRRYTNRGILPHERSAGNQRRFKLSSVLAFKEDQQRPGGTAAPLQDDHLQDDHLQDEQAQDEQAQDEQAPEG